MPVSLLALYRRPDGGDEALETFRHRYAQEHLPLVRETPGLRSVIVHRVSQAISETDLVMVTEMIFDNREELDAALTSEPMRQASRNLREIAPGLATVIVLEPEPESLFAHDSTLDVLAEATLGERGPRYGPDGEAEATAARVESADTLSSEPKV